VRTSRRGLLRTAIVASGLVGFSSCSKLGDEEVTNEVEIKEIWLFNIDSNNARTISVKLLDGNEVLLNERYNVEPKEGDVAGEVKIKQQLPDSPGQYSIVSWLESHPGNKGRVNIYEATEAGCVIVDISISDDRNYPAIFTHDDCN
jgi:hypothetical protein